MIYDSADAAPGTATRHWVNIIWLDFRHYVIVYAISIASTLPLPDILSYIISFRRH